MRTVRLGDFICRVRELNQNREAPIESYCKASTTKEILPNFTTKVLPSKPESFQILRFGQFVCASMIGGTPKIGIGRMEMDVGLVSSEYFVFECVEQCEVLPSYLHLVLISPKFDDYIVRLGHGAGRYRFSWETLCNFQFQLPDLTVQEEVVRKFQVVGKLIATKRSMLDNILETVQVVFKKLFMCQSESGLVFRDEYPLLKLQSLLDQTFKKGKILAGPEKVPGLSDLRSETAEYPVYANSGNLKLYNNPHPILYRIGCGLLYIRMEFAKRTPSDFLQTSRPGVGAPAAIEAAKPGVPPWLSTC